MKEYRKYGMSRRWCEDHPIAIDKTNHFYAKMKDLYKSKILFYETKLVTNKKKIVRACCKKHGTIEHTAGYWLTGKGCEYCNGRWFQPDWEKYARDVHGDKYEYLTAPKIMDDKIQIKCPVHGVFTQSYHAHIKLGNGCPECAQKHLSLEKRMANFLNKAQTKYGDRFAYAMNEYIDERTPFTIICREHNYSFKTTPDTHLRKSGCCPMCSMPSGEIQIAEWLKTHGINSIHKYSIDNNNPQLNKCRLEIDFYLPDHDTFIEFNGEQHYMDVGYFRKHKNFSLEVQQLRDQTVRDYCARYGHKLIEIRFDEKHLIAEILQKHLLS